MKKLFVLLLAFAGLQTAVHAQGTYKINVLEQGQELWKNQSLRSENGQFTLILQTDGNLCIYKKAANYDYAPVWCSGTNGKGVTYLQMQADGNLGLYGPQGHIWSTDTYRGNNEQKGGKLVLGNDGSLVLNSISGKAIWKNGKRLY